MLGLLVHREFGDEVEDERGVGGGGGAEVGGQGGGVDSVRAMGAVDTRQRAELHLAGAPFSLDGKHSRDA